MRRDRDCLQVAVEDNGLGFAPDRLAAASGKIEGFGLFSIRERLNYFGGHMEIESIPGLGTSVILTIPLKSDKQKRISRTNPPAAIKTAPPAVIPKAPTRPPATSPVPHRA
jgi:signal transduction histidine kinase